MGIRGECKMKEVKNNIPFDNLLPKNDLPITDDSSFKALEYAISDQRIRNIGITGNYGAGKSSFLLSFFNHKNLEEKCINVSLASFSLNGDSSKNKESKNESEIKEDDESTENEEILLFDSTDNNFVELSKEQLQNIEISILHQLIYKHSVKELPNSRLPRITGFSIQESRNLFKEIIFFSIFFFLILLAFLFPNNLTFIKPFAIKPIRTFLFLCGFICCIEPFSKFCIWLIRKIKNTSLKRVSFKNAEVELDSYKSDSILNQRLDEILYFFEQTKYEYVVFEDLDRFNSNQIFIHLREINKILNENNKINRSIKFIYAVKDQMFKNEERVKFFDFIIPIIPVINNSSAASELIDQSKNYSSYFEKIDTNYFAEIGSFINDFRLLKNILNEYYIYHDKLNMKSENNKKLFSLIVYKNLYPIDFSNMQRKIGDIEFAFNWKKQIAKELNDSNNAKINSYQEHIEKIKKECTKNVSELKMIYLTEYARLQHITVDSNQLYNLSKDDAFLDTKKSTSILIYQSGYSPRTVNFDYSFFEKITIDGLPYSDRKQIVENGISVEVNHYLELIRKERDLQSKLVMMPFSEIYNRASEESKKELKLSKNQLYFLRRNLIDENYRDYISLFKEGVLTVTENDFINSVRIKDYVNPETSLNNLPVIFESIRDEFINNSPALLNFDLLNYLLNNKSKYEFELRLLLNQIIDEKDLIFLNNYISHRNDISKYFNASIELIEGFWDKLLIKTNTEDDLLNYCYLILKSINDENREIIKKDNKYISYLNTHSGILQLLKNEDNIESILNNLKNVKICFETLDIEDISSTVIFEYLISNRLFKINKLNLYTITKNLDDTTDGIYTKILKCNNQNFINLVNENINILVKEILLDSNEINEDENVITALLNSENIEIEDKYEIIKKMDRQIFFVSKINNSDLYDVLFKENKVFPNWENIYNYFKSKNDINDILISYIKEGENSYIIGNEKFGEQNKFKSEYSSFATLLYQNEKITVKEIENLEKNNEKYLDDFNYELISTEKLEKLMEILAIEFSQKNLDSIRSINQDLADKFVFLNKLTYIDSYNDFVLRYSELSQFIYDEEILIGEKIFILKHNLDKLCAPDVKFEVLQLIEEGNLFDKLSKNNVINLLNSKDFIFGEKNSTNRTKKRILLLAKTNNLFDNTEFLSEVIKIENDFDKLNSHKTATIEDKEGNLLPLCDVLKDRQIIHNYKVNNGKITLKKY